ncbi:MAG: hydrogenase [Deltaproteobacteria bacterium]|nr:hydrogenase [Deltaproteobacteria bacterium]
MRHALDFVLVTLVLTDLVLLGSSRLTACIRLVAAQGVLLAFLPLALTWPELEVAAMALAASTLLVKGVAFPLVLERAMRDARARREIEPFVGYTPSLLVGLGMLGAGTWLADRLSADVVRSPLMVPVALSMILTGLFFVISRKKAVSQVLGYLVLENGTYVLGISLLSETPFLVELGMLLDVFVAVFVMGIAIFQINREFDHIDVDQLDSLKG